MNPPCFRFTGIPQKAIYRCTKLEDEMVLIPLQSTLHDHLKVGDLVVPVDSRNPLRSGAEWYAGAVVIRIDPKLVLVSERGDMRWEDTIQSREFRVVGRATDEMLALCKGRL